MQSALLDSASLSSSSGPSLASPAFVRAASDGAPPVGMQSVGGYGERSGSKVKAVAITVALHAVAIAMLVTAGYSVIEKEPPPVLTAFEFTREPPPPPPPQPETVVKPDVPAMSPIVAPPVDVPVPTKNPVQASPEPPKEKNPPPPSAETSATPSTEPSAAPPVVPPGFKVGQGDTPLPEYPFLSSKANEQGVVILRVVVGTNGRAKSVSVQKSSGYDRLDKAALDTVKRKWRFSPAMQGGKAVEAIATVPITFKKV